MRSLIKITLTLIKAYNLFLVYVITGYTHLLSLYNYSSWIVFCRKCRLSIKYYWALDNMTPTEYVKKHLKKPEISNLRGTALE